MSFTAAPVLSQKLSVRAKLGYGWYSMSDLKTFLNNAVNPSRYNGPYSRDITLQITDNFPGYLNPQIEIVRHLANGSSGIGFAWNHVSTGGRIAYEDYSGKVQQDWLLSAENIGFLYEEQFQLTDRFWVTPSLQLQATITRMKVIDHFEIYQAEEGSRSAENKFDALGIGISPYVSTGYDIKPVSIGVYAGYYFGMSKKFDLSELRPEWNGLRAGLTVGWSFY